MIEKVVGGGTALSAIGKAKVLLLVRTVALRNFAMVLLLRAVTAHNPRSRLSDKTNPPSEWMSLNKSQRGNCSTEYNAAPVPNSSAYDFESQHRLHVPLVDRLGRDDN